jgi:hypothetical protein
MGSEQLEKKGDDIPPAGGTALGAYFIRDQVEVRQVEVDRAWG